MSKQFEQGTAYEVIGTSDWEQVILSQPNEAQLLAEDTEYKEIMNEGIYDPSLQYKEEWDEEEDDGFPILESNEIEELEEDGFPILESNEIEADSTNSEYEEFGEWDGDEYNGWRYVTYMVKKTA